MYSTDTKSQCIELRAKGGSLARIAARINATPKGEPVSAFSFQTAGTSRIHFCTISASFLRHQTSGALRSPSRRTKTGPFPVRVKGGAVFFDL